MTTLTQEYPDENEPIISIEAKEISSFAEAIQEFDTSQNEFLDTIATVFTQPVHPTDSATLSLSVNKVIAQYKKCIEAVHESDTDQKARIATMTQLVLEEEDKHIKAFVAIVPESEPSFSRYTRDVLQSNIESIYNDADNDQEAAIGLLMSFAQGLGSDTTNFLQFRPHIEEQYEEEPKPSTLRVIGKHALDVAKLGLGITAGIVAASLITKRR